MVFGWEGSKSPHFTKKWGVFGWQQRQSAKLLGHWVTAALKIGGLWSLDICVTSIMGVPPSPGGCHPFCDSMCHYEYCPMIFYVTYDSCITVCQGADPLSKSLWSEPFPNIGIFCNIFTFLLMTCELFLCHLDILFRIETDHSFCIVCSMLCTYVYVVFPLIFQKNSNCFHILWCISMGFGTHWSLRWVVLCDLNIS